MGTRIERTIGEGSVVAAVVAALADAKGVTPLDIETPLYDVVDTDALERIFEPIGRGTGRIGGRLIFDADGYEIAVHGTERVVVSPVVDAGSRERALGCSE